MIKMNYVDEVNDSMIIHVLKGYHLVWGPYTTNRHAYAYLPHITKTIPEWRLYPLTFFEQYYKVVLPCGKNQCQINHVAEVANATGLRPQKGLR